MFQCTLQNQVFANQGFETFELHTVVQDQGVVGSAAELCNWHSSTAKYLQSLVRKPAENKRLAD